MNGTPLGQRWIRGIFLGIFFISGSAFLYFMTLRPFFQGQQARAWVETPCRILSSGVKASSDSDGTTYSVEVAYEYQAAGKQYRSERYQFLRFSSGGRKAKEVVTARYPKGSRAVCYVNPRNPSDAVLDRTPWPAGWWGAFPLIFIGVGAAGVVSALRGGKSSESAETVDEPWMRRADWASGRVVSEQKGLYFLILFAVVWNAFSMPVAWTVLNAHPITKGHYAQAFVLIFPLVGVAFLIGVAVTGMRYLRFGKSYFDMAAVPGALGGVLEGTIRIRRPISPLKPVQMRLACISRFTVSDSDGNSTKEAVIWEDDDAEIALAPGSTEIPVAIRIPADTQATTSIDGRDGVFWRLEVKASIPGVDYKAQWEVPVYEVELLPGEQAAQDGETGR